MMENTFAFRLKELLEHHKLTLQAVASVLGISRTAVHKWTRGGEIDYDNLRALAAFLKVNWIWLRYGEEALRDVQGAEVVELPMTDVRRRYTTEIMASEARMQLAQENARIVTWEWNLITDEITYSANVEDVYGWSFTCNEDFWPHLHPDDVAAMAPLYRDVIANGTSSDYDFRIFRPDGEMRWIASRATIVKDAAGRAVKMVGISMDDTERKSAEEALRASEERFRAIFELAGGAMAYIGLDGTWLRVNDTLCALLGYSAEELAGLTFQALTHPDDLETNLEQWQRLLDGKVDRYAVHKRFRRKSGEYVWANVRTSVQRNAQSGSPEHLISVIDDISEQRAHLQALQARIDELQAALEQAGSSV